MSERARPRHRLASSIGLLLVVAGLLPFAAPVSAASPDVVISQVYGGGGNSGATYTHDFVELFNRGTTPVSIDGWSIQYASATGTGNFGSSTTLITPLAGSIAAGQYVLVQEASNAAVGAPLPTADITDASPISMGAGAGKVAVVNSTTPLGCNGGSTPCSPGALATIVDLVGYGTGASGANFFEGAGAAPTISATTADFRAASGCTDTDNNGADFAAATPAPRNTAATLHPCSVVDQAPSVLSTLPEDGATNVPLNSTPSVTFSEPVNLDGAGVSLDCTVQGSKPVTVGGGPQSFSLTTLPFVNDDHCTIAILAGSVTDVDASDPPDTMAANFSASFDTPSTATDVGPTVTSTTPADDATSVARASDVTIAFSEPVNVSGTWFTISCSVSGAHTATVSGGPATFTLNPDADFVFDETCTITVLAANVTDQDATDPPDNLAADVTFDFATVTSANECGQPFTATYAIQGSGSVAAITGNVTTSGVVVGDFETATGLQGFYLQDVAGDANVATSDGIFVFTGTADTVAAGDLVRVTGFARERFNMTAINGANDNNAAVTNIVVCATGAALPPPVDVTLPFETLTYPERYEGMLVRLPQNLVISEYFNYDQFGEIVLAKPVGDESRPFTPTAVVEPGAAAIARAALNARSRITLDDAKGGSNPTVLRHPNGEPFSLTNRFRGGDTVANAVGVLSFDFSLYRIMPTGPATYTEVNPRPVSPEPVGGTIRAAAMNTLNFFLTLDTTASDSGPGPCGGNQNLDCRGADSSQPDEFTRQRTKLLQALSGLDADIVGLNEIENTPGVSPLGDPTNGIVAGLNAIHGPGTYAFIDTGVIGTDAIRVGIIYKPAKVTPVGAFKVLTTGVDPRFLDTKSRPVLAQTFEDNVSGGRITVAVNHLKSKGSACTDVGDPDAGDGQGNCNGTRTLAAQALVDWLATDPTGAGDPDYLILGDLNSYALEDPIDAIKLGSDDTAGTADDFTNLIAQFQGPFAHSYVFDGQAGYLDHALASSTLVAQVTGAADWHIDSDEPDVVDYDTSFKPPSQEALYEPNPYRASDHDPVVVGLNLNAAPTVDAGGPYAVNAGSSVMVSATGSDPEGRPLTYAWDLDDNGSFETAGQTATFDASAIAGPATLTIHVQVTDASGATATDDTTVVVNAHPTVEAGGPYPVVEGQGVSVSATGTDPEAGALTYAWDLDDNGSFETPGQTVTFNAPAGSAPSSPTIRVRVTDPLGLTAIDTATVNIIWAFTGFLPPLSNPPIENQANSGSSILVQFRLGGNQGPAVIAAGYPRSIQYTCGIPVGSRPTDATSPTASTGFAYDPATNTYSYSWKTDKSWKNTCRRFVLKLADGSFHYLDVRFAK